MPSTELTASVTASDEATAIKTVANRPARPVAKRAPATVAKRPVQAAPKTAVQAVPAAPMAEPVEAKSDQLLKPKKSKKVRQNVTLPMLEYLMLETLKLRSSKLGSPVKKNVLVRAGIKALAALSDARFLDALKTVPSIKAGRSSKD